MANEFSNSNITYQNYDHYFGKLLTAIFHVIEMHAPLQTVSRKPKCLQHKSWLTEGLLVSTKNKQKSYYSCFRYGNDFDKAYLQSIG